MFEGEGGYIKTKILSRSSLGSLAMFCILMKLFLQPNFSTIFGTKQKVFTFLVNLIFCSI